MTPTPPEPPARDHRLERFWRRMRRVLLGETDPSVDFDRATAQRLIHLAARGRAWSVYGDLVTTGSTSEDAAVATIRALSEAGQRSTARAFAVALAGHEEQARVGLAQVMFASGSYAQAWELLRTEPVERLGRWVPVEAVTSALASGGPEAVATARELGEHGLPGGRGPVYDPGTLLALAGRFLVTGHRDLAERLFAEAVGHDLADDDAQTADNLSRWLGPERTVPSVEGAVSIGVIDYHSPDLGRSSKNIGDYVQTLAMLGNLARFSGVRFSGEEGIDELMVSLQARVRPELVRDGGDARVRLMPVSRDFSSGDHIPENTWMLAFGWHMHPLYLLGFGLPYHPHLNPIFVSFHLHRTSILTPAAIDYLREHGPIGCRDWTTVDLLLSAGVDAFFTGCLTSTVSAVFPDRADVPAAAERVVAVIDLPPSVARGAKRRVETISHLDADYRQGGLVAGVRAADELLHGYQRDYHRVITRRLHSYLPATSLGVPVSFRPAVPGDARFAGLSGMQPGLPAFEAMQDGLRRLIGDVFDRVLRGADREQVYAFWRETTAASVAEAEARHRAPSPALADPPDPGPLVAPVRESATRFGPHDQAPADSVTDLVLGVDPRSRELLPVALESVVRNASGPLRLWLTARGTDAAYAAWLAGAFPGLPVTVLPVDSLRAGAVSDSRQHATGSALDRLLLPELLPDLDRVVCLDVDTVTEGDVCALAAVDLGETAVAARRSSTSASHTWRVAGDALDGEAAAELRRVMAARHAYDFATFNTGVLVLDLDRLRDTAFSRHALALVRAFGLTDQEAFNALVGPHYAALEPRWNALVAQELVTDPGVIHFVGAGPPWGRERVPYGDRWRHHRDLLFERVDPIP